MKIFFVGKFFSGESFFVSVLVLGGGVLVRGCVCSRF